ncbi:short-chain dehydrogenase [Marinitenerispora sediminis]|uniref:Short-chain dehydrogenase n=2 Tax=Marinitenerispora sediminis TaxID=1931232 RepID=A0A368TBM2_9ACTN|nr:short-chain dehydrogenase [Marinitenerispora sediminis]RCV57344.1 short-chain dehydrogenase [Marinitenerispora sediminis]RCV62376.1 short-chain dehydrogenase [Marinitenerispora sediminis]
MVTGASVGIGAEYARRLAERGFALVLVARRADLIEELAAELRASHGVDVAVLPADLADASALAAVEERLRDDTSPVDLLVNNAGVGHGGELARQDPDLLDAMVDLNVRALVRLTRAVLPGQIRRRAAGGTGPVGVLNVASVAGLLPASPGGAVYAASKAFVRSFTHSVAVEAAPHGVAVTVVLPGYVRTDMTRDVQEAGLPDVVFVAKERVVVESLRAWAAGAAEVIPGVQYKAASGLLRIVPGGLFRGAARRLGSRRPAGE